VSEAVKAEAEGGEDSKVRASAAPSEHLQLLTRPPAGLARRAEDAWPRGPQACEAGVSCSVVSCCRRRLLLSPLQTVMTSVYGVTFMGARDQISNRRVALTRGSLTALTSRGLAGSRSARRLSTRRRTRRWRCMRRAKCWTR
jgi:hypothetical protein